MLKIHYLPDQRVVESGEAYTILDASLEAGIPHTHICGGNARCSTCRILILNGQELCAPRTLAEQELADKLHWDESVRLACQTEIIGDGDMTLRRLSLDADDVELFHNQASGKYQPQILGQEKHIAILFADIRGFTSFSEALLPYDVIYVLNRYFQRVAEVINRQGGVINAYMGDGLMALFGVENPDRAVEQAVRAGLEMLEAVEQLNPSLEMLYQQRLRIGIGIHYGWVVLGTIGDPQSPKMTAIGDAVNFASRIESANKSLGTTLLVSDAALQAVANQVQVTQTFQVSLPGKSGEYQLYAIAKIDPISDTDFLSGMTAEHQKHDRSLAPVQSGLFGWIGRWGSLIRKAIGMR